MRQWPLLIGAIVAEVTGTLSLRASIESPGWALLVVLAYAASFTLLGLSLRSGLRIGTVYSLWGAAGVACVAVLGAALFGETLSLPAVIGIFAVIAGVVLVESGAHQEPTAAAPRAAGPRRKP